MEGIYIIDDGMNRISDLEFPRIDFAERKDANDYHNFVVALFENYEIGKLIIPIRLGKANLDHFSGLILGLHIRLTSEINNKRFIPLIFIGEEDLETVLLSTQNNPYNPGYLLTTKGCVYLTDISKANNYVLAESGVVNYERDVLNHLKLNYLDIESGKHSLSNIWGALRLNDVLRLDAIPTNSDSYKKTRELYFKYLRSYYTYDNKSYIDLMPLNCNDKKILLIDDESNKGWFEILRTILKGSNLESINFQDRSFEDAYMESQLKVKNNDWDLILLDLRLNPETEDLPNQIMKPEEYSGFKLLQIIKEYNEGIPVIVLTASNKAWNMKKLLDAKADGYYIKESPEFNFSPKITKENYDNLKNEIIKCFKLSFLKNVFQVQKKCFALIDADMPTKALLYKQFYERTKASLYISFELLKKSDDDAKYMNLAFLTYYQILEDYVSQYENFRFVSNKECYVDNGIYRVINDSTGKLIWKLKYIKDTHGDYFEKLDEIKTQEISVQSLAKISFVLAFKFNKDNVYLKNWGNLNNIRNTKAGHGGANNYISINEIMELLEIIELFLTP